MSNRLQNSFKGKLGDIGPMILGLFGGLVSARLYFKTQADKEIGEMKEKAAKEAEAEPKYKLPKIESGTNKTTENEDKIN